MSDKSPGGVRVPVGAGPPLKALEKSAKASRLAAGGAGGAAGAGGAGAPPKAFAKSPNSAESFRDGASSALKHSPLASLAASRVSTPRGRHIESLI